MCVNRKIRIALIVVAVFTSLYFKSSNVYGEEIRGGTKSAQANKSVTADPDIVPSVGNIPAHKKGTLCITGEYRSSSGEIFYQWCQPLSYSPCACPTSFGWAWGTLF